MKLAPKPLCIIQEKEQFKQEILLLFKLRHPNIVQFVNMSRDSNGGLILISEYLAGAGLNGWLYKKKFAFAPQTMKRLAYQIAAGTELAPLLLNTYCCTTTGLAFLHVKGIVHRDLKSDNVLLDGEGMNAKIADLGLAKPRSTATMTSVAGTIMYMAPEVLTGQGYKAPADVYSFSLVRS